MHATETSSAPWSLEALRQATWHLAEDGMGPFLGAKDLVARNRRKWPRLAAQERIAKLLEAEGRKQFTAALALAAVSTVALPAGLPASLAAAHLLDARLALAIAIVLGYSLDAPGVREVLQEAVMRPPLGAIGAGEPEQASARPVQQAALSARLLIDYAAPKALKQGRQLLLRYASGRWQRRLLPVVRAVPAAGQIVLAAFEARAMRALGKRVQEKLARLPTEAVRTQAVAIH